MHILDKEELIDYLYSLRRALVNLDCNLLANVIFINQQSLYSYYSLLNCDYEMTVGEMLEIIEPYIPFAITQTTLDYFIFASMAENEDEMRILEKKFNISAKLDFINIIRNTHCEEEWSYLLAVCEKLRQSKNCNLEIYNDISSLAE